MGGFYNVSRRNSLLGTLDFANDTIMAMLYRPTFTYIPTADYLVTAVAHEVSGVGYSRKVLVNKTVVRDDLTNAGVFSADNLTWSPLDAGSVAGVLLYKLVTDDTDSILLGAYDLALPYMTNSGAFTIKWAPTGILRLS